MLEYKKRLLIDFQNILTERKWLQKILEKEKYLISNIIQEISKWKMIF